MKCPHLIKWVIESCKADCKPYVPSMSELESYCKNEDHGKCSFYERDIAGTDAARLFATLLVTEERQAVKMAG